MDDDREDQDYCKTVEGVGRQDLVPSEKGAVKEKPPPPCGGPLMKLKCQSSGELSAEDIVREPRICSVCNREFSSGKALGGHMRVHIQASKREDELLHKLKTAKLKKQSANASGAATNNADDTTCSLCGKNFPSMKSLFGHMRCHPERHWRGIQPPQTTKNSSSSTLSELLPRLVDDHFDSATTVTRCVTDLQQSLSGSGWSVTDKRGRKSFLPNDDTDADADAVYNLLMLGRGDFAFYGQRQQQEEHKVKEECESNSPTNKVEIEEKNHDFECTGGPRKRVIEASVSPSKKLRMEEKRGSSTHEGGNGKGKVEAAVTETRLSIDQLPGNMIGAGLWPEAYWRREAAAEDESDNSKNTYDGSPLGDQLNSNNSQEISMKTKKRRRRKLKLTDLETTGAAAAAGDIAPFIQIHQKQIPTTPDRYRCSTCNKSFPTHQALGGHRSSHNKFKNSQNMDDPACADAPSADYEHYGYTPNATLVITQSHEAQGCNDAAAAATVAASASVLSTAAATTHQCRCCNKAFPTGQALGGHMRCHWNAPSEAPPTQVTSPGEASQTGPKVHLEFDLNEPPAMEEEEEEEEEGIESVALAPGDSSSSHNSAN